MNKFYEEHLQEYRIWAGTKRRCFDPNNNGFATHGGLGITICERWRTSFTVFIEDMGHSPIKGWHLHRINNEGDYEPGNCVWVEPTVHSRMQRRPYNTELTKAQNKILDFIASQKLCPTIREIGDHFNISVKGAYDHVKALERKGKITRQSKKSRSIVIL